MNPGPPPNPRIRTLLQGLAGLNAPLSLFWAPPLFFPFPPTAPIRTAIPCLNLLPQLIFGTIPTNVNQMNLVNTNAATPTPSTDSTTTEPASDDQPTSSTESKETEKKEEDASSVTVTEIKSETEPSTPENVKPESTSLESKKVDFRSVETLSCGAPLVDSQRINQSPDHVNTPKSLKRNLKRPAEDEAPIKKRRKQSDGNTNLNQVMCHCDFCGKGFTRQWLLQGHIRTHTGEKPFKCQICGKPFADKSNLRAHVQTHSEEKPFTCVRCGKRFALKSYLSKHEESACSWRNRPRSIIGSTGLNLSFGFGPPLVFQ